MNEPLVCTVRANGIGLRLTVYATADRAMLPEAHRLIADATEDGAGLFVAEHARELDSLSAGGPRSNGSARFHEDRAAAR